jgi:hypothetical protein
MCRIAGIDQQTDLVHARNHFDRKRELFAGQVLHGQQHAGHVAAGSGMARGPAECDWIDERLRDDRYGVGRASSQR